MVCAHPLGFAAIAFTAVGSIFALARLFTRGFLLKSLKWDDLLLTLAFLAGIGGFGVVVIMSFRDLESMPEEEEGRMKGSRFYWEFQIFNEVAIVCYTLQNMFSRLSLLMSYKTFTPKDSRRWQRRLVNIIIVVTLIIGIFFAFIELFPCWPVHMMIYPNDWAHGGKYYCLEPRQIFQWSGYVGVPLDLAVYILPFWLLRTVKISDEQRFYLYGLFGFGGLVFVISVIRVPFLLVLSKHPLYTVDLYELMQMWLFTVIEANMLLCAATIPTLRPLWRAMRGQDPNPRSSLQPKSSVAGRDTPETEMV